MLNNCDESGHPCLVPDLRKCFQLLTTEDNVCCGFLVYGLYYASPVAQLVKNPPTMWKTWIQFLGWEDPQEKGKSTHSSILAWKIPWSCPWGHKESDTTEQLSLSLWAITKNVTKTVICFPFFPVNSQCLYVISCTHNPVPSVQFSSVQSLSRV